MTTQYAAWLSGIGAPGAPRRFQAQHPLLLYLNPKSPFDGSASSLVSSSGSGSGSRGSTLSILETSDAFVVEECEIHVGTYLRNEKEEYIR